MLLAPAGPQVWLFVPVRGYCRPDLPVHYREKISFVLRRMASVDGQKATFAGQAAGLLGFAGVGFFSGSGEGKGGACQASDSWPQERFLAADKIRLSFN